MPSIFHDLRRDETAGARPNSFVAGSTDVNSCKIQRGLSSGIGQDFDHSKILCAEQKPHGQVCENIEKELSALYNHETAYREVLENGRVPEKIQTAVEAWRAAFPPVFENCRKELDQFGVAQKYLPKGLAFTYSKLFVAHGLMHYNDFGPQIPFKKSLNSFKLAFLLMHYSLGFSPLCPDFSCLNR